MNGYLGLTLPTAVRDLVIAVDTVCSRYPSMGSVVTVRGSFLGGSLWGSVRFQYFSGVLSTNHDKTEYEMKVKEDGIESG